MIIRRGGVTDFRELCRGWKSSVSYLFNTSPRFKYGKVISQLRVLASHTGSLGSVAQGGWQLTHFQIRTCHFLSDPCVFGYIF